MKKADITAPGDYEYRPYLGGEKKVTVLAVEQRSISVVSPGEYTSHKATVTRAVVKDPSGSEWLIPLNQIIRPWAEAAIDHAAADADRAEGERIRLLLEATLSGLGIEATVRGSSKITVVLDRTPAEVLADVLEDRSKD